VGAGGYSILVESREFITIGWSEIYKVEWGKRGKICAQAQGLSVL